MFTPWAREFLTKLLMSTAFAVFLYAVYIGWSILLAVLYAAIAVFLTSPILSALESYKIPKFLSAGIVCLGGLLIFVLLGGALIPLLLEQLSLLASRTDEFLKSSQVFFATPDGLRNYLQGTWIGSTSVVVDFEQIQKVLMSQLSTLWSEVGTQLKSLVGSLATGLGTAIAGVTTFVLTTIFYLFLAVERDRILGVCQPFFPKVFMSRIHERTPRIHRLLLTWWKGQILMSGAMALTTLVILIFLRLIGVEVTHIFSLALIAGLCVFIPVIWPIVAAIPAALSVASGGFVDITIVIFAYFCIQQIEGFVLIPRIQGNSLKLSDFEVIFWMTLSGSLFGILGILVTLPLLAVSKILLEKEAVDSPNLEKGMKKSTKQKLL